MHFDYEIILNIFYELFLLKNALNKTNYLAHNKFVNNKFKLLILYYASEL